MTNLQKDLANEANLYVREIFAKEPAVIPVWDELSIFLIGSGITQYASEYSGLDLLILVPDEATASIRVAMEQARHKYVHHRWKQARPRSPRRFRVDSYTQWRDLLDRYDDEALYWMDNGWILHDPSGAGQTLKEFVDHLPEDLWMQKSIAAYQELRRRKASLAWSLRRGHQLVVLDNIVQILHHTLSLCFYLQGEVPAPRKWLFRGALRTEFGGKVRGIYYELFQSFSDLTTLGGSDNLQLNKIYQLISMLQHVVEEELATLGWRMKPRVKESRSS